MSPMIVILLLCSNLNHSSVKIRPYTFGLLDIRKMVWQKMSAWRAELCVVSRNFNLSHTPYVLPSGQIFGGNAEK